MSPMKSHTNDNDGRKVREWRPVDVEALELAWPFAFAEGRASSSHRTISEWRCNDLTWPWRSTSRAVGIFALTF